MSDRRVCVTMPSYLWVIFMTVDLERREKRKYACNTVVVCQIPQIALLRADFLVVICSGAACGVVAEKKRKKKKLVRAFDGLLLLFVFSPL